MSYTLSKSTVTKVTDLLNYNACKDKAVCFPQPYSENQVRSVLEPLYKNVLPQRTDYIPGTSSEQIFITLVQRAVGEKGDSATFEILTRTVLYTWYYARFRQEITDAPPLPIKPGQNQPAPPPTQDDFFETNHVLDPVKVSLFAGLVAVAIIGLVRYQAHTQPFLPIQQKPAVQTVRKKQAAQT